MIAPASFNIGTNVPFLCAATVSVAQHPFANKGVRIKKQPPLILHSHFTIITIVQFQILGSRSKQHSKDTYNMYRNKLHMIYHSFGAWLSQDTNHRNLQGVCP
jgi:hypothetical protein